MAANFITVGVGLAALNEAIEHLEIAAEHFGGKRTEKLDGLIGDLRKMAQEAEAEVVTLLERNAAC